MFVFRDKISENFVKRSQKDFERRMVSFMKEEFDDTVKDSDRDLGEAVHNLTEKAFSYGLTSERSVGIFIITAWYFGLNFDVAYNKPKEILESNKYDESEKATHLRTLVEQAFSPT